MCILYRMIDCTWIHCGHWPFLSHSMDHDYNIAVGIKVRGYRWYVATTSINWFCHAVHVLRSSIDLTYFPFRSGKLNWSKQNMKHSDTGKMAQKNSEFFSVIYITSAPGCLDFFHQHCSFFLGDFWTKWGGLQRNAWTHLVFPFVVKENSPYPWSVYGDGILLTAVFNILLCQRFWNGFRAKQWAGPIWNKIMTIISKAFVFFKT